MFLTSNVKVKQFNPIELYEDIINFNEEYNDLKYDIILQEHTLLLEGKDEDYIEESISETLKNVWNKILEFIKKVIEKAKQFMQFIKRKAVEIINKFNKTEEVRVDKKGLEQIKGKISEIGYNLTHINTKQYEGKIYNSSPGYIKTQKIAIGLNTTLLVLTGVVAAMEYKRCVDSTDNLAEDIIEGLNKEKGILENLITIKDRGDVNTDKSKLNSAIDKQKFVVSTLSEGLNNLTSLYPKIYQCFKPAKMNQLKSFDGEKEIKDSVDKANSHQIKDVDYFNSRTAITSQ
jgi:hypothetical protein